MARNGDYKLVAQGSFIVIAQQFLKSLFFGGSCVDLCMWQNVMELYIKTTKKWVHAKTVEIWTRSVM